MAKITFYHDTRSGNGEFPLKLRITHHSKAVHINLDIKLAPEQWDGEKIINHKSEKSLNDYIATKKTLAESAILTYGLTNSIDKLSANELKTIVESGGETATKSDGHNFLKYYESKQKSAKKNNTRLSYDSAIKRMKLYDLALKTRTFEDIDEDYIRKMDEAWEKAGLTTNSRAVYMRNIRAVFNDAIDDGLTTAYPFRRFSIKKAPTKKRNLSLDELRALRDYPIVNDFQQKYRDLFMLCFYLRGINMVDLLGLTKDNIRAGRINYVRAKTGKFYSVKIEPEAKVILSRYKGTQYLIDVCDGSEDEKQFEGKVSVVNASTIKPLDYKFLDEVNSKAIITLEENSLIGGFGSLVRGFYAEKGVVAKVFNLGVKDEFVAHSSIDKQLQENGLTIEEIEKILN